VSRYEELRRDDMEFHPVDVAVEARLKHSALRRRMIELRARVVAAVLDPHAYLELEELSTDERRDREEAFFNLGYEYGASDVRHRVVRQMTGPIGAGRLEHVASRLRDEIFQAGLSTEETLLLLVESLWMFALGRRRAVRRGLRRTSRRSR
jgi:hypothetical protein